MAFEVPKIKYTGKIKEVLVGSGATGGEDRRRILLSLLCL